jgi:hypothetical protein
MSTKLITQNVWETLTAAARAARQPCDVAVAYRQDRLRRFRKCVRQFGLPTFGSGRQFHGRRIR